MAQNDKIQLFEDKRIRTAWDEEKEEWYFSIVDVVAVLTDQPDQRGASNYWAKLKQRLKEEGADQLLTNCQQLKMKSPKDGKRYNTDVADTEQLLRIVQSIPSEISRAWSGMSTRQYKNLKGLKKENLRDNMTTLELVLNMLAEATTTQFSKDRKPSTFQENLEVAKAGGQVAGRTRKDIESQSNTPVISPKNAAQLNQVVTDLLEGAAADTNEMPEEK